jgi:hypothetical protein
MSVWPVTTHWGHDQKYDSYPAHTTPPYTRRTPCSFNVSWGTVMPKGTW